MVGYIFGGNTGITSPGQLAQQREIAAMLAARASQNQPKNLGEGLGAIADIIAARRMNSQVSEAEAAGQASANSTMAGITSALMPQSFPASPQAGGAPGTEAATDYPSQRVAQAFGESTPSVASATPVGENWLAYANQGATRNQPLSEKLTSALSFLPEMGVTMKVFSGGQDADGPRRTGSHRHDHGNAGDVFFYKDGRQLDWSNPQDLPIFQDIVRRGKAAGVTGFGAGEGYMRPGSMHLGFGSPAVWGAGGRGESAPGWLKSAYNGQAGAPSNQVASLDPSVGMPPQAAPSPAIAAINQQAPVQTIPDPFTPSIQGQDVTPPQQVAQDLSQIPVGAGGTAGAYQPGSISLPQLLEAAQNPNLSEQQRGVVELLLKREMDRNAPKKYDFMAGKDGAIFRTDSSGNMEQVYGGKPDTFRTLTAEEKAAAGLPAEGAYQIGADNKISQIGGGGTTVNIDQKAEGAFDKKLAEKQAETFDAMANEGLNARADLGIIGELDTLLKGQGGTLTGISGIAAKYGVGGEGIDDLQAAQALINKLVPTQRQPGSGSMSDRDVELFTRSLPSLWNSPGGNEKILGVMRGLSEYKQNQGEIADMVLTGEISRQEARKMLRELPNPLKDIDAPKVDAGQKAIGDMTDEELEAIVNGKR